jgi:Protein of unknown function (DUF2795)
VVRVGYGGSQGDRAAAAPWKVEHSGAPFVREDLGDVRNASASGAPERATRKVRSMHRESEKHGPVRDEHRRKETENLSRSGAGRTGEGRPGGGDVPTERPRTPPRGMSPADVARRAALTRHLPPSEFPADRARLLTHLRSHRAPELVIDAVSGLPEGQQFQTLGEVVRAIGLVTER